MLVLRNMIWGRNPEKWKRMESNLIGVTSSSFYNYVQVIHGQKECSWSGKVPSCFAPHSIWSPPVTKIKSSTISLKITVWILGLFKPYAFATHVCRTRLQQSPIKGLNSAFLSLQSTATFFLMNGCLAAPSVKEMPGKSSPSLRAVIEVK